MAHRVPAPQNSPSNPNLLLTQSKAAAAPILLKKKREKEKKKLPFLFYKTLFLQGRSLPLSKKKAPCFSHLSPPQPVVFKQEKPSSLPRKERRPRFPRPLLLPLATLGVDFSLLS